MAASTIPAKPADTAAAAKRDFRQEVTDRIIAMLEKGAAPWQKPWNPGEASVGIPFNPTSDRAYRGGNAIHLMATAVNRGYGDPRWMTYKQASDRGWQVRRGEKGTHIEFWDVKPNRDEDPGTIDDGQRDRIDRREARLIHRVYTVFNATQIDGVPAYQPRQRTPFEVVQSGEKILENSGANIRHDQADRAFYNRSSDSIHLPSKEAFKDAAGYYGTTLHELAHWTGHPSRLNRATLNESYRFGDPNYAKEELRAELTSVFLAAERGIPHDPEQHAAYVGSWIKTLREDKNEIFRAAHDASLASDFLLSLERDRSIADETLAAGPALDSVTNSGAREPAYEQESANLQRDREDLIDEATGRGMATPDAAGNAATNQPAKSNELSAARMVATGTLGEFARTVEALVDAGNYRGAILGETEHYLVQRQSAGMAVLHQKDLLDRQTQVGEVFSINYSNGRGIVREFHERAKSNELSR
ncbi:MAG TPA: zincin-like metallopeptidase domain-containing protein [Bryobacteraceae bacterium]|nr:zincin-like metallopeptidase domain-containing protein [Bryobacteraceae bacterium]